MRATTNYEIRSIWFKLRSHFCGKWSSIWSFQAKKSMLANKILLKMNTKNSKLNLHLVRGGHLVDCEKLVFCGSSSDLAESSFLAKLDSNSFTQSILQTSISQSIDGKRHLLSPWSFSSSSSPVWCCKLWVSWGYSTS